MAEIQAFRQDTAFHEVPSIAELLNAEVPPYPYTKSYRDAVDDVAIIIHSSGTTGKFSPG